jgi:superfamily II DNA or RNA helicase
MNLKNVYLKDTYWSGEDNLIYNFYLPCLNNSIAYDRAVGFFSSSIFNYISDGLYQFIINGGKMRIVCSTKLSENDIKQIKQGYEIKTILEKNLETQVEQLLLDKDKPNIKNLCWLIKNNRLDIKICLKSLQIVNDFAAESTLFHEKFGIFKDNHENVVSFLGSVNESIRGWLFNEESFEVSYSWEEILKRRVQQKIDRFEILWNGLANEVTTCEFPVALKQKLIKSSPEEPVNELARLYIQKMSSVKHFVPRKCQREAYEKFKESNYICMYQMATGSGKTKAALYSFKNLSRWKLLLILVPGSELVTQWENEIKLFFPNYHIIKCGSDFGRWKSKLLDVIQAKIPEQTIVISTYDSAITDFSIDKWLEIKQDIFGVICDEAHNLGGKQRQKLMELTPKYRIGLSATPSRNFDEEGTEKILSFFNHQIYEFSIKAAIREGYLVEYEYYIYPCILNKAEWNYYIKLSKEILKIRNSLKKTECVFENGNQDTDERLKKKLMERAEILKTAEDKLHIFPQIINSIPKENRILVYADSLEHLRGFGKILNHLGREYFIYTGDKDSKIVRPKMLEEFRLGIRKILLAINCLDEGVDIPNCDVAIFISSSTSERQFIQRRGRVLRKSIGKHRAYIYDYLVIPDYDLGSEFETELAKQLVLKEYHRINIVSDDAINGIETRNKIDEILERYQLGVYNY